MAEPAVAWVITEQAARYRRAIDAALLALNGCEHDQRARAVLETALRAGEDFIALLRQDRQLDPHGQKRHPPHVPLHHEPRPTGLTPAQKQVLSDLAAGLTLEQISQTRLVTVNAVTQIMRRLADRFGVTGRTELVQEARRQGLV